MEKQNNIFIYLLVLFFSIFLGTSLFLIVNKERISNSNNLSQKKDVNYSGKKNDFQEKKTIGYFKLKADNKSYSLNNEIKVFLIADSQNKNISGFDIILNFNKKNFDFIKANSLLSDFDIYPSVDGDRLILTGVKSLSSKKPISFNNTSLLEIIFKAKNRGNFDLLLEDQFVKNKTKMVDEETNVLKPNLENLNLEIN